MISKKAQGMSMKIIIVSILLLVVLGVLTYMFFNGMNDTNNSLKDCGSKGGYCSEDSNCLDGGIPTPNDKDDETCRYCCIKLT